MHISTNIIMISVNEFVMLFGVIYYLIFQLTIFSRTDVLVYENNKIREDIYENLVKLRREGESFSDVIERFLSKPKISIRFLLESLRIVRL